MRDLFTAIRFLWIATRGHRLRPWQSPYLRWRFETYTGKPAAKVGLRDFWRLGWHERQQLLRFLGWMSEMKTLAEGEL